MDIHINLILLLIYNLFLYATFYDTLFTIKSHLIPVVPQNETFHAFKSNFIPPPPLFPLSILCEMN